MQCENFFFVLCKKFLTSLYYVHKSSLRYACYTHTPSYHPVSQQKLLLFLTASWDSGLVNFKPESFFTYSSHNHDNDALHCYCTQLQRAFLHLKHSIYQQHCLLFLVAQQPKNDYIPKNKKI